MEDPFHSNYPQDLKDKVGPRNLLHCLATDTDDPTVDPRWGKVGKQKIVDEGPLPPHPMPGITYNMETVDEVVRDKTIGFIDQAKSAGKPFFIWMNPTRMHIVTHLSEKYEDLRNSGNGWSIEEAGMAQLDDVVGAVMQHLKDVGIDDNTIVVFSTDNGTENFTWPDGGQTPFAGGKGTALEGGFRVPCILRWPGKVQPGKIENGVMSGLDWFPTFVAAAGNPNIVEELQAGKQLGEQIFKVHLDGYNQLDFITGASLSKRNEVFYFTESTLGAVRINDYKYRFIDQPGGWTGNTVHVDWPILTNLRLDPFERTGMDGSMEYANWYIYEFWRFVFVQQEVAKFGESFVQFPPMQTPASFNLEAVKAQILKAIQARQGH
jgi:arylsulfatase A-like enzyme